MKVYNGQIKWNEQKSAGTFRTNADILDGKPAILYVDELKKTRTIKKVYQWRYKNSGSLHWKLAKTLLTVSEAKNYYADCSIQKHAGPFKVPKDAT